MNKLSIISFFVMFLLPSLALANTEYSISIHTGTVHKSGTGAKVFIKLYGENGRTEDIRLDNQENNFENGQTDTFLITTQDIGDIKSIRLRHDNSGEKPGWYVDSVEIRNKQTGKELEFIVNNWLASSTGDGKISRRIYK